jgi:hypothetical protein
VHVHVSLLSFHSWFVGARGKKQTESCLAGSRHCVHQDQLIKQSSSAVCFTDWVCCVQGVTPKVPPSTNRRAAAAADAAPADQGDDSEDDDDSDEDEDEEEVRQLQSR